jgi:hypothetical protein
MPKIRPQRYKQIIEIIDDVKPQSIVEIGVWNGQRAIEMVSAALLHHEKVSYHGFDLFESANATTDKEEMNAKKHCTLKSVRDTLNGLKKLNPGFSFKLTKGNTRKTLKPGSIEADFVYIDGGHSVETIRNDYEAVKESRMVVFDDFYNAKDWDLEKVGANKIIEEIPHAELLPSEDPLSFEGKRDGTVHLVKVDREKDVAFTVGDVSENMESEERI